VDRIFCSEPLDSTPISKSMSHPDEYKTIKKESHGEFRDRGSKFIAYLLPCRSDLDIKEYSDRLRKEHPQSRHVCIGAIIGHTVSDERSNDDGEPSGTAGLPILNQIRSAGLTYVGIFIVRYFGGTKLGKPGLIQAYKESAKDAIDNAVIQTAFRRSKLRVTFPYDLTGKVMKGIDRIPHSNLLEQEYGQVQTQYVSVPVSEVGNALLLFDQHEEISIEALGD
jgi:uncharacterized YigZ family protein